MGIDAIQPDRLLGELGGEIAAVFHAAHGYARNDPKGHSFLNDQVARHADRRGFRFLAAFESESALAGFAYGYEGGPGEWWHDRVAAALTEEDEKRWLGPAHFELVELAVRPELQLRGIGGRLHDEVLATVEGSTAVLSTQRANERALAFYRGRGWRVLVDDLDFGPGYQPYRVLGIEL